MTTNEDLEQARMDAQMALLEAIKDNTDKTGVSHHVARWAEAYAWIRSPAQSHGGGTAPPS